MALTDAQPTPGTAEYAAWVERQNQDLINYRRIYEQEMRQQGITVTWASQESVSGPFTLISTGNATLTRDGVSYDVAITRGRAQQMDAAALARNDIEFGLKFKAKVDDLYGGPIGVPSPWFGPTIISPPLGPNTTPGPETPITRTQPPTVTTPATTQPAQTPPNPNSGTVVTPPPDDYRTKMLNWDQWNYYWSKETGRPGPDPLEHGIDRTRLISYGDYLRKIDDILNTDEVVIMPEGPTVIVAPPGNGPTTGGPFPLAPPAPKDESKKDDMTGLLVIAGIAVLLILVN